MGIRAMRYRPCVTDESYQSNGRHEIFNASPLENARGSVTLAFPSEKTT